DWIERAGGVLAALTAIQTVPGVLARRTLWCGISQAVLLLRYRDHARFRPHATEELAVFCAERIDHDIGRDAARIVVALAARGEAGQLRLAGLFEHLRGLPQPLAVLQTVLLWDSPRALAAARTFAAGELPTPWQFHLSVALAAHGDPEALPRALAAARTRDTTWSFRRSDWDALCNVAPALACALALADSPHHHAYQP